MAPSVTMLTPGMAAKNNPVTSAAKKRSIAKGSPTILLKPVMNSAMNPPLHHLVIRPGLEHLRSGERAEFGIPIPLQFF